jgi:hypothetical protein
MRCQRKQQFLTGCFDKGMRSEATKRLAVMLQPYIYWLNFPFSQSRNVRASLGPAKGRVKAF